jgi:hypothetical protein
MKAMSLVQFGRGRVDLLETDKPTPGPTDVLVSPGMRWPMPPSVLRFRPRTTTSMPHRFCVLD